MNKNGFFELSDYINEMTKKINLMSSKMLLQDIIMIYNGCYGNTYDKYLETIKKANEKARDFRILDSHSFSTKMMYTPDHVILEEFEFDYIIELRRINNGK